METERNLLFVVLAFESEFLSLGQLTSACRAWAEDKSQPLSDLLVARGWMTAEDRAFVEKLLERKLAKHQNDPRITLNSVVRGDVCDAIKEVDDADIQQSLSSWPSGGPVLVETLIQSAEDKPKSRYTWISEVGHGGLGIVWKAIDNDLAREIALKEIRPDKSAASQEAVRRLIKEAQITGQLQHPNIVPVYEVNRGGRPFYTMKLVKGETLTQAIKKHHEQRRAARSAVPPQPEDPLSMPRLMSVFLNVCDAIGYAHSRRIIHRDLKPENIVLGDYGEAIVLDWGLAKKIADPDDGTESVQISDDAQTDGTRAGRAMGSPRWMPPEQAAGRLEEIDKRSDVYGLGAILFHILTGEPPHSGTVVPDILQRIIAAPTPCVRDLDASIPEELDAICAKAMAKDRAERYQTANDLKAALQEYDVHKASIEIANIGAEHLEKAKQSGGKDYAEYNRALVRFEEAVRQWPDNSRALAGWIDACASYTRAAFSRGDYALAEKVNYNDDQFQTTIQKAAKDRREAMLNWKRGKWSLSLLLFFWACLATVICKKNVSNAVSRSSAAIKRELADAHYQYGDLSLQQGQLNDAFQQYHKGTMAMDDLTEEQAQRELIAKYYHRGQAARAGGDYATSITDFNTVVTIVQTLKQKKILKGDISPCLREMTRQIELMQDCKLATGDWSLIENLPDAERTYLYYLRVFEFANLKKFSAATETLDRWVALMPTEASELYLLARGYGLLSAALTESAKTDFEVKLQRQELLDAGLATLRKVIETGYSDFAHLGAPDFAPFREHPGYKELVEQLSKPKRDDVR